MGSKGKTNSDSNVRKLRSTTYKPEPVMDFLEMVFHSELGEGEEILTWACSKIPGYPVTEARLEQTLTRSKKHQAFYYGTSTCHRAKDGNLYNRKALFSRLHAVVLDDIGTKIDKATLPEGLEPTYIIRSSEGNEQWGFVLDEPIDVLDHAQLFVTMVYQSGYTDTGGNMPTKLVRLPCGFNMKPGKEDMQVKLLKKDGPLWSPDDLLKILETGVSWEAIQNTPDLVKKNALTKTQGATPWAGIHIEAPSIEGIVDPALEWLYSQEMVYQERDHWVDIRCPWHHEHSEGGKDSAGYSPLGWGEESHNKQFRGFNCFHDSCGAKHAQDFLEYVAEQSGLELPVRDYVPEMISRYVYDRTVDGCWDLVEPSAVPVSMAAMKNLYARKIRVVHADGKVKGVSPVTLWLSSPSRVDVNGAEYRPGERSKLFRNEDGHLKYNLFHMKHHDDQPVDQKMIKPFYDYLDYLIPDDTERTYFLDWLACKVQDPAFRGPAIFMVAEKQGIGRNTLVDMIGSMFGHRNMAHVPFNSLVRDGSFNAYQESLFVVVDETLALDDYAVGRKASDKLKEIIDPRPQLALVNPKYGKQREVWTVASYIFLSNHADGLRLTENDRRYYPLRNAFERNTPSYYGKINAWMKGDEWQQHLWNSLMDRDVDIEAFAAPPEASKTMAEVIDAGLTPLSCAIQGLGHFWPTPLIPVKLGKALISLLSAANGMFPEKNLDYIFRQVWKENFPAASRSSVAMKVKGVQYRLGVQSGTREVHPDHPDWGNTRLAIEEYNETEMATKVMEYMEERGFEF